ncbi:MAG: RusA family crossover junction endodeoxyribonuclease [Clostridia bacterium]
MKYEFEVIGEVIGKERPRVNMYTGSVYTPGKTKDYEILIQQYFKMKYPNYQTLDGRISIEIVAYLKIPKSTSKLKKQEMLDNKISPTKKPDVDNIAKVILDAMNKFVFKDDNQVAKISIEKRYGEEEKIWVSVEEY